MERIYTPTMLINKRVDPWAIRRFIIYQIEQIIEKRYARTLDVKVDGNNVLDLSVTIRGRREIVTLLPDTLFYEGWIDDYKRFKPMASPGSPAPYIVVVVLLAAIGFAVWAKYSYQYPGYDEVNKAIAEANNSAEFWEIRSSDLILHPQVATNLMMQAGGLSRRCSEVPKAQFLVGVKDQYSRSAFLFDSEKYTIDIGGDYSKINNFNVCQVIDQRLDVKYRLLEMFRGINADARAYRVPINAIPIGDLTVELVYMCIKIVRAYSSCVEVLVKGYADGQDGDWIHWQERDYYYPEVSIYPKTSNTGFEFNRVNTQYQLPSDGSYANPDLPYLRAMFVKRELIDRFMGKCEGVPNVTSHILEGHEFKQKNPSDRKVQVFVVLY